DQMREPARAARRRIDLGAILVARLGLMQKPFDTRQVERDVAIAAVEAMRPRDEREPILVLAQPARRRGTDPREAGDERSQQLALVGPRRRLRLHAGNEDDAGRSQRSGFMRNQSGGL